MKPIQIRLTVALLAGACAIAQAQTDNYMPEGSKDIYVGVSMASVPRAQGDGRHRTVILPFLSVQASNGVFVAPGAIGLKMSGQPDIEYGPILTYSHLQRADSRDDRLRLKVEAGGFVDYALTHGVRLSSTALYGGGDAHRGLRMSAAATATTPLAPHHALSFKTGVSWANHDYLQSYYGVSASPGYRAAAGLHDVSISGNWAWEMSTKFSLSTGLGVSRLLGSAADSPIVRQRTNPSAFTALSYHY